MQKKIYGGLAVAFTSPAVVGALFRDGGVAQADIPHPEGRPWHPNEVAVVHSEGEKASALAIAQGDRMVKVDDQSAMGIKPRNKEQTLALAMLMDPKIQVVTLTGIAGSGKSLLAVAAGLQQSFGARALFKKLIYIKSTELVGKDLGFLPGSHEDKLSPFMGALHDCLGILKAGDKDLEKLVGYEDKDKVQKMSSQYIRGRTFRRAFLIVDEAQNFSTYELKLLLTRLDDESKIAILGDVDQSDVNLRDGQDGLVQVVERFKDSDMFAHLNLLKSERSKLAQLVGERL